MRTEEELVHAMARGEEYALEILFDRHYDSLWKYVLVILKNPDDTREVINDTFYRVFRYAGTFSFKGSFAGWLFRIAKNLCMDHLNRRNKSIQAIPSDNANQFSLLKSEDSTLANDMLDKILVKLENLKPEYRDIIILKDITGYSIKEIAAIMEKSVPAIKTLHHRALRKLRSLIAGKREEK